MIVPAISSIIANAEAGCNFDAARSRPSYRRPSTERVDERKCRHSCGGEKAETEPGHQRNGRFRETGKPLSPRHQRQADWPVMITHCRLLPELGNSLLQWPLLSMNDGIGPGNSILTLRQHQTSSIKPTQLCPARSQISAARPCLYLLPPSTVSRPSDEATTPGA